MGLGLVLGGASDKGGIGCSLDEGRIDCPAAALIGDDSNVVGVGTLFLGGEDGTGEVHLMVLSLSDRFGALHVFDPSVARPFVASGAVVATIIVSHCLDVEDNSVPDLR